MQIPKSIQIKAAKTCFAQQNNYFLQKDGTVSNNVTVSNQDYVWKKNGTGNTEVVSRRSTALQEQGKQQAEQNGMATEEYQPSGEGLALLDAAQNAAALQETQDGKKKGSFEDMIKALKIAQNLMQGKVVPPEDEQFLQQYSAELYQAAKNIAMMQERGEEVESELEDEESDFNRFSSEVVKAFGLSDVQCSVDIEI